MSDALSTRKQIKSKKPVFKATDAHKIKRLKRNGYKKGRGYHNKQRLSKRGFRFNIRVGYKSPIAVRHTTPQGLYPVLVHTVAQLESLDPKTQAVIVASNVGGRKKLAIVEAATKQKLTIMNVKDAAAFAKAADEALKARSEKRKAFETEREAAKSKKQKSDKDKNADKKDSKKTQSQDPAKDAATAVDAAKKEKKEQDKILTKAEQ